MKWLAAIVALAIPVTAQAQAYQCSIPQGSVSVPPAPRDGPVRETRTTGYTLSLSWSPEYCRFRADDPDSARQCSGRAGRFAFVVHGLWPEGRGSQWPQWCPSNRMPSPDAVRAAMCMTPDAELITHEWAKHGTCMTDNPDGYLRATRILWASLRWPDYDRISRRRGLTAGDIREAFADANPYWDAEDVGLVVSNRGWLREMRLCYGTDFMPTACDTRRYGPDDDAEVQIWRGL